MFLSSQISLLLYSIFYQNFCQAPISLNVIGNWRFAVAEKGFAKQRPATAKCGGVKRHKGQSPTGVLRNPSRLLAAMLLPGVMRRSFSCDQLLFYYLDITFLLFH